MLVICLPNYVSVLVSVALRFNLRVFYSYRNVTYSLSSWLSVNCIHVIISVSCVPLVISQLCPRGYQSIVSSWLSVNCIHVYISHLCLHCYLYIHQKLHALVYDIIPSRKMPESDARSVYPSVCPHGYQVKCVLVFTS